MEGERDLLYLQFPQLQMVRQAHYTPHQWDRLLREFVGEIAPLYASSQAKPPEKDRAVDPAAIVASALAAVPRAKADLVAAGYSKKELDAMPDAQIVMLHVVETHAEFCDEMFKVLYVPYWQIQNRLEALDRNLESLANRELIRMDLAHPGVTRIFAFKFIEPERELAALRCIEALRFYAAAHDGKLPASLDDIKEVPIPLNPVTGKALGYRLDGATAIIDAESLPADFHARQYRVTVAK